MSDTKKMIIERFRSMIEEVALNNADVRRVRQNLRDGLALRMASDKTLPPDADAKTIAAWIRKVQAEAPGLSYSTDEEAWREAARVNTKGQCQGKDLTPAQKLQLTATEKLAYHNESKIPERFLNPPTPEQTARLKKFESMTPAQKLAAANEEIARKRDQQNKND